MDKILTFIKKYTSLLIPAGILLFALILLIPTTLWIDGSTKEKMDKSVKQGRSVSSSLSKAHSKIDVDNMTLYQNQLETDSQEVARLVKQTTQRELISYDVFPEPAGSSNQIYDDYGTKYRQKIEELLKSTNARSAPTTAEIKQELEKRGSVDRHRFGMGAAAMPRRRGRNTDAYNLTRDAFLKKRAQEMSVYATANVFDWYTFWEGTYDFENEETALEHCWYSQISYWVYEDVVETIKAINSGSLTVFKSGVKRLVGVNFQRYSDYLPESGRYAGMSGFGYGRSTGKGKGDTPKYILKVNAPGAFGFAPWTARFCDGKIDVIHFSMAVVIRADSVFPFIKELCSEKEHTYKDYLNKDKKTETFKRNQITVLQYWQEPVNKDANEHLRYRYGDDAVVKLNLTCEYVFTCSGYDEIKPDSIVKILKPDQTGAGAGAMNNMYGGQY